jgi:hypothetical protein
MMELFSERLPTVHEKVADCFSRIADKPCWDPKQGHGSFLTFEFGEPYLTIREINDTKSKNAKRRTVTVRGAWHLWIYCCHWKISQDEQETAHSESSRETIEIALARLRGQILSSVSVIPESGASVFEFDLGGRLETSRYIDLSGEDPDENWFLSDNQGKVLSYRADGRYSYHRSDETTFEWID